MTNEHLEIRYRLPVSTIRLRGTITTTIDTLEAPASRKTVAKDVTITLEPAADTRHRYTLALDKQSLTKQDSTVKLSPDGLLTAVNTSQESLRDDRVRAILSAAVAAGATALPLAVAGGPLGIAAAAGVTLLAAGAAAAGTADVEPEHTGMQRLMGDSSLRLSVEDDLRPAGDDERNRIPDVADDQLGIHPQYRAERSTEYVVLRHFRRAVIRAQLAQAMAADDAVELPPDTAQRKLLAGERALAAIRVGAARAEELYQAWRATHRTVTVEPVDELFYVDELPTAQDLEAEATDTNAHKDDRTRWAAVMRRCGTMMSCDLLDDQADDRAPTMPPPGHLVYVTPMRARLICWQIAGSANTPPEQRATKVKLDTILVSHPKGTALLPFVIADHDDRILESTFDASGSLTSLHVKNTPAVAGRIDTVSQLPVLLHDAAKNGSELATYLSPAVVRSAMVKQQLDAVKDRQELDGLLSPSPDELAGLRQATAQAELEARLRIAQYQALNPNTVVATVRTSTADHE